MGRRDDDDDEYGYQYGYRPYVSVAQRRAQAAREVTKRKKEGLAVSPVQIAGRKIATTFWGIAWCDNLEGYSDFANRLPRGRTYVRNGSVVHLKIDKGRIEALVSGSELYDVRIDIEPLPRPKWQALTSISTGKVGTLVELLQGKLSKGMMELVTGREHGLFPSPKEIKMKCSCPDGAYMCKHIAAVLYGVGNRLDTSPEMLFALRGVDHLDLIEQAIPDAPLGTTGGTPTIAGDDLGSIFGIDLGSAAAEPAQAPARAKKKAAPRKTPAPKKTAAKKSAPQTAVTRKSKTAAKEAAPVTLAPKKSAAAPKKSAAKAKGPKRAAAKKSAAAKAPKKAK